VKDKAQGVTPETVVQVDVAPATEASERFAELYEHNFAFVWRSVRMLGLSADAVDDAVQDVFLVAHRRLADFEARSSPRTWLFAIVLRVVSDHRRSRRRRLHLLERALMHTHTHATGAKGSSSPYEATLNAQRRDLLLSALARLPDEQRAIFILAELEEMSAPEISAALEVNVNTVYSRLRIARRAMLSALDEHELATDMTGSRDEETP
jgi:RNA polymerase sigma-70 factor, ECF subfamily